jgi:hypothetical protein
MYFLMNKLLRRIHLLWRRQRLKRRHQMRRKLKKNLLRKRGRSLLHSRLRLVLL